jgi:hypothetical protein
VEGKIMATYVNKNGMRFVVQESVKEGYHIHEDISEKLGANLHRVVKIHLDQHISAGLPIAFRAPFKSIKKVRLNNYQLTPKIDYIVTGQTIAFTFNLTDRDKIEIEGFT